MRATGSTSGAALRARDAALALIAASVTVYASTRPTSAPVRETAPSAPPPSLAWSALPAARARSLEARHAEPPHAGAIEASCSFDDRGPGDATEIAGPLSSRLFVRLSALDSMGQFTLLVHLHAGEAARKVLLPDGPPVVLATFDRGPSSRFYEGMFATRRSWDDFVAEVDRAVSAQLAREARARRVIVSSFSAGYAGVDSILSVAADDTSIAGLVLLDSLYAGYGPSGPPLRSDALPRFLSFARRSLEPNGPTFALTHSDVATSGYASTREVADHVIRQLALRSDATERDDRSGLTPTRVVRERGLVVLGYEGGDAEAHCAHLRLLPELVRRAVGE